MNKTLPLIPAIENFLENWKQRAKKYYMQLIEEYQYELSKPRDVNYESLRALRTHSWSEKQLYSEEKIIELLRIIQENPNIYIANNLQAEIKYHQFTKWKFTKTKSDLVIVERCNNDLNKLNQILEKEVDYKRAKLFELVSKKAGNIVDANGIKQGEDGTINGCIIGENQKVYVETIYAGGYNIQCLHFRILVKPIK